MPQTTKLRRRLRLRDLDTFLAVVQNGGMRKAAEQLHLSQAAVSKAVGELEQTLGVTLLARGRRGVESTPEGMALAQRARAVFDELESASRELAHLRDPEGGEIHLGCMDTLHAGLMGAVIARLGRQHPRMRFQLESGQAPELIEHFLRQRLVDFVVARPHALPLPGDVAGEPLFHDQLRVAVGLASPLARRRRVGLDELTDAYWILSRNETLPGTPLAAALDAAGLPFPGRRVVSGSLNLRLNLLETGRFITLVPHSVLPFAGIARRVKVLPIALPPWHTPTMILTLRERVLGSAALRFLAVMRELAQPLATSLDAQTRKRPQPGG